MADRPVLSSYPHDRLSRLAEEMTAGLPPDVRAVVLLNDEDGGVVHSLGYPSDQLAAVTLMIIDMTEHLIELGRSVGLEIRVTANGVPVPWERDRG